MSANDKQVGGQHYKNLAVQPWDALEAWLSPEGFSGFLKGSAIAYLARGRELDLDKAIHYLEKLREVIAQRKREEESLPQIDPGALKIQAGSSTFDELYQQKLKRRVPPQTPKFED